VGSYMRATDGGNGKAERTETKHGTRSIGTL